MNLFMQGMRRSGTTIVFDALARDPRFDAWYEPFSAGREGALGGGSGIQQVDLMDRIREHRRRFVAEEGLDLDPDVFNHGAPRDPAVELEPTLPETHVRYIRRMTETAEHSVFKFTRMYCKIPEFARVTDDSVLAVLVRHPQEVVASYLYGRDQRRAEKLPDADAFFGRTSSANPWNARRFVERIAEIEDRPRLLEEPDWRQFLALWEFTCRRTMDGARAAFDGRFEIVRYEDMAGDPRSSLSRLYGLASLEPDPDVLSRAEQTFRPSTKACHPDDPRWLEAYDELGVHQTLTTVGYDPTKPARPPRDQGATV